MAKPSKKDIDKIRSAIQQHMGNGLSFDEARARVAAELPDAFKRIVESDQL